MFIAVTNDIAFMQGSNHGHFGTSTTILQRSASTLTVCVSIYFFVCAFWMGKMNAFWLGIHEWILIDWQTKLHSCRESITDILRLLQQFAGPPQVRSRFVIEFIFLLIVFGLQNWECVYMHSLAGDKERRGTCRVRCQVVGVKWRAPCLRPLRINNTI